MGSGGEGGLEGGVKGSGSDVGMVTWGSSNVDSERESKEPEALREREREPVWDICKWMGTNLSRSRWSSTGASGPRGDSLGPDLRRRWSWSC